LVAKFSACFKNFSSVLDRDHCYENGHFAQEFFREKSLETSRNLGPKQVLFTKRKIGSSQSSQFKHSSGEYGEKGEYGKSIIYTDVGSDLKLTAKTYKS